MYVPRYRVYISNNKHKQTTNFFLGKIQLIIGTKVHIEKYLKKNLQYAAMARNP